MKRSFLARVVLTLACIAVSLTLAVSARAAGAGYPMCPAATWDLIAGDSIKAGTVTVTNDTKNLYVTYKLTYPGAAFGMLRLWAGNNMESMPATGKGTPMPDRFPWQTDAEGLKTATFTIPFSSVSIVDSADTCSASLYVTAYGEVRMDGNHDGIRESLRAFAGNTPGMGPQPWHYGLYGVCCVSGRPFTAMTCDSTFAKGGWVWVTDAKANPENLPSLNLTNNKWGWAINLKAAGVGTTVYDLWAAAGLNDTSKGYKTGTLTVTWTGLTASVTYDIFPAYTLQDVHLYADDVPPTTTAPGQFGYSDSFDPTVSTYTFKNVPLADTDADGVWLIGNATVCTPDSYLLTVTKAGNGAGTVTSNPAGINCGSTCSASYASGTKVTLTATPAAGSTFTGWSGGGCSGTGTCTVTMDAAKSVVATFTGSYTLVTLKTFTGAQSGLSARVVLQWTTASEYQNAGFYIARSETANGTYTRINSPIIPAKGTVVKGAAYSYADTKVQKKKTYYYKLEDVDTHGKKTFHGPLQVEVK